MHTRRLATFLLGIWLGCGALMALLLLQNDRPAKRLMDAAGPSAAKLIDKIGRDDARSLLNYQSAEQSRAYSEGWLLAQLALACGLMVCILLGTQKRAFPLLLCALMLGIAAFQLFVVLPELTDLGRSVELLLGNADPESKARVVKLAKVYAAVEAAKLGMGGILAAYLFIFRTKQKKTSRGVAPSTTTRSPGFENFPPLHRRK